MRLSIIIPAHNEENNIEATISSLESNLLMDYVIIVVDDHSTDTTKDLVKKIMQRFQNISLVENKNSPGFANALRAGFLAVNTELFIPVMADLCDEPRTINEMYKKIQAGFDVVCGSRYMKGGKKIGGPLLKTFFSRFVGLTLHWLVGIPTVDIANSFKMYKKEVLDNIDIKARGFEISLEMCLKAYFLGYKITEIPTMWIDRKKGKSKFSMFRMAPAYIKLYLWAIFRSLLP
ncbi:MAG: glycosyltransferase [Candidatus Omnitrophica bacterium]|nr:glycosyltransferase [Candidatus Omnitrophota bacterium]